MSSALIPCVPAAAAAAAAAAVSLQTSDLLARSSANKALNDKKRLMTSSANVARSRCGFGF
jgi:photosystem I subunit PsaN